MTEKEIEFFNYMFTTFWGSTKNENGVLFRIIYEHECYSILQELKLSLDALLTVYGAYYINDVENLLVIEFHRTLGINTTLYTDDIKDLALLFDSIYGDSLGTKYYS